MRGKIALTSALATFSVHCSLTVSPGDYTSGLHGTAPPASNPSHVIVVAGERDRLGPFEFDNPSTDDVWTARIGTDGVISGWTAAPAPPLYGNTGRALLRNGSLFVRGSPYATPSGLVGAEWIGIGDPTVAPLWNMSWVGASDAFDTAMVMTSQGLIVAGGFGGDTNNPTQLATVTFAPFEDANRSFDPPKTAPSLVHPRQRPMITAYRDKFVYVLGGQTPDAFVSNTVEVAPLTAAGPGAFAETKPLVDPSQQQKPYNGDSMAFCAGDKALYVVGGQVVAAPSPVVLMATVDESNGQLEDWKAMPQLPFGGLEDAGCFVAHDRLYVIGGKGATSRTAQVLSAPILPGGAIGPWDLPADKPHQPLPAPRSQIAATAY